MDHQPVIFYVAKEDFQWIWAALSGYEKDSPLSSVLQYPLPYADGYIRFWNNPLSIQHPLAAVEIPVRQHLVFAVQQAQGHRTSFYLAQYNANRMLWYSRFPRPLFRRVRRRA